MKAIVYRQYGGPDVLRLEDVEEPRARAGQVRLKVKAIGVNPLDYKIRRGSALKMGPLSFPAIPGREVAGIVDQVGESVVDVSIGDEVLGWATTGAYAEYALAIVFAPKPPKLDWETAASLPVATETSDRVLNTLAVTNDETLLIHGAAGVVGSVGVQLAVAHGATVVGTASESNHDFLRSLGAIPVTYGGGLADRVRAVIGQDTVDAVYDATGHDALEVSIQLRGGTTDRIITIADYRAPELGVAFSGGSGRPFRSGLTEYARLATEGRLQVRIAESLPLADARRAHELSESGHSRGKLILRP